MFWTGALRIWEALMSLRSAASAAFIVVSLAPALANPLERELAALSNSCWERTYDAAHLKAHPGQRTVKIRLSTQVQDDGSIVGQLGINMRKRTVAGGRFDYAAFGYCKARQDAIACPSEWDAGTFLIEKAKGGLLVHNKGMIVNPSNYDSEDIAPGAVDLYESDDKSWLLKRIEDEGCDIF
jgi:hypothetical protein